MTLGEFKTIIKVMVPSAAVSRVSDEALLIFFNKAAREVNYRAEILRKTIKFDTADKKEYPLSDIDAGLIKLGESGIWYNTGTEASPYYTQLDSVNRAWLDERYPNWVNDTNGGQTLYAFVENFILTVYPKPSTVLTDGFLIPNGLIHPQNMAQDSHYPFTGSDTERPDLTPLDDAIIDYVRFILKHAVGSDEKGIITRSEFEKTLYRAQKTVRSRPDYINSAAWEVRNV